MKNSGSCANPIVRTCKLSDNQRKAVRRVEGLGLDGEWWLQKGCTALETNFHLYIETGGAYVCV